MKIISVMYALYISDPPGKANPYVLFFWNDEAGNWQKEPILVLIGPKDQAPSEIVKGAWKQFLKIHADDGLEYQLAGQGNPPRWY